MSLYFIIFGRLIGSQIGSVQGFDYIQYITGLVMMSVITNSYNNVVSSFYSAKYQRNIEEILTAPVHPSMIVLGFTIGGVIRGILVGFLVTLTSLFFTTLPIYSISLLILVIFLTSFLFSLAGLLNALFAKNFDDVTIIQRYTNSSHISGWSFLFDSYVEQFLANCIKIKSYSLYGKCFSIRIFQKSDIDPLFAIGLILLLCIVFFIINIRLLINGYGIRS